jgi:hypothetical protein
MKKTTGVSALGGAVAALLLLGGYGTAFGQGQLNFFTYNSTNASLGEVFQSDGVTPAANGTFSAELFGSTTGLGGSFSAISSVTTFVSGFPGYISYGGITLPTASGNEIGATYYYELLVWTASAGSYAAAQTINGDQYGTSQVVSIILGGDINHQVLDTSGFSNLTLTLVPEPATCALMGLGGLSLLLFRRRK